MSVFKATYIPFVNNNNIDIESQISYDICYIDINSKNLYNNDIKSIVDIIKIGFSISISSIKSLIIE